MLLRAFNKAWERERDAIEVQLMAKLDEQIRGLHKSINSQGYMDEEMRHSLMKMRNELVLRKALAVYESEDIARNRMQLRSSYLAVIMSAVALIISVVTVLAKVFT
jgi:hypothetical protein